MPTSSFFRSFFAAFIGKFVLAMGEEATEPDAASTNSTMENPWPYLPTNISEPVGVRFFKKNSKVTLYTFSGHNFKEKKMLELSIPMVADRYDASSFHVFLFLSTDWYATPGYGPNRKTFYRTFHRYTPGRARIFINTLQDSGFGENFTHVKIFTLQQMQGSPAIGKTMDTSNYDTLLAN